MFGRAVNDSAVSDAKCLVKLYGKAQALRYAREFCEPYFQEHDACNEHWFAVVLILNDIGALRELRAA